MEAGGWRVRCSVGELLRKGWERGVLAVGDVDRRVHYREAVQPGELDRRNSVLHQQVVIHGAHAVQLFGLIVDQ